MEASVRRLLARHSRPALLVEEPSVASAAQLGQQLGLVGQLPLDHGAEHRLVVGPTVHGGRLDTDLLVTRTTMPLRVPAAALLRLVQGRPPGGDSQLNIR